MNNKLELSTRVIDNEDFNTIDLEKDSSKNRLLKKRDKKFKIALAIFIAIILCLLSILILMVFYSSSSPKEQTDQTDKKKKTEQTKITEENKEIEEKSEIKYLNLSAMPEFKKFYEYLPYTLTIGENNGEIDINYDSLLNVSVDDLEAIEENKYQFSKIEIGEESKSSSSEHYDLSLFCNADILFHSSFNFEKKTNEVKEGSKNISYIMIKKKLGSITVKKEKIKLTKYYENKILNLAKQEIYTVEEKAKKLDELFTDIGYFIPSKITIGGYFYKELSQIKNEAIINIINEIKGNINFDKIINSNASAEYKNLYEDVFKNLFQEEAITIVGGNTSIKASYDEWEKSLNYENAKIIEHNNNGLIEITKLIDDLSDDIKSNLKEPLDLVSQKYDKRKKYYKNLNKAKEYIKKNEIKGDGNKSIQNGLCQVDDLIYNNTIKIKDTIHISKAYVDIIVGWSIISNWGPNFFGGNDNGKYCFKDPILSKKLDIKFESRWFHKQDYTLIIFFIKNPENQ